MTTYRQGVCFFLRVLIDGSRRGHLSCCPEPFDGVTEELV